MDFQVKIEVFEGPFDLLLQLILSDELDIHKVPIALITDSYIEHIEKIDNFDLDSATEFLLIAATLLLLKARSLFPQEEEEALEEVESSAEVLADRLVEYKKYSNVSRWLEEHYALNGLFTPRFKELETDYSSLYPDPFEGVSVENLSLVLLELLSRRAESQVDTSHIAPIRVSVAKRIEEVRKILESSESVSFKELAHQCKSRIELVATFLAILELYKSCEIDLEQRKLYGDIRIRRKKGVENNAA